LTGFLVPDFIESARARQCPGDRRARTGLFAEPRKRASIVNVRFDACIARYDSSHAQVYD